MTKCNLSSWFSFEDRYPNGDITVNVDNEDLFNEIFRLFTPDGLLAEDQSLGVWFDDFTDGKLENNYEEAGKAIIDKENKFKEILKKYGVTKCNLSSEFSFEDRYPNGDITVNVKNRRLYNEIFILFTSDGFLAEDQSLGVWYNSFEDEKLKANYDIEG